MRSWFPLLMRLMVALAVITTTFVGQVIPAEAAAELTITPITWNVVGLDSNDVNVGPNNFPVGARVCNIGDAAASSVTFSFAWDTTDLYINLRPGSYGTPGNPFPTLASLAVGACKDVYFEVQVTRDPAAYDNTALYHITAGCIVGPSFLYRREVYERIGNYADDMFHVEDYDYWLRVARYFQLASLRSNLYLYRENQNSLTAHKQTALQEKILRTKSRNIMYIPWVDSATKANAFLEMMKWPGHKKILFWLPLFLLSVLICIPNGYLGSFIK